MKIALYGDSYGVTNGLSTSWPSVLSNMLGYEIDNYSLSGSSVYYSFTKFLETYTNYDTVIFLITDPFRYPVEVNFSESVNSGLRHVSGLVMVEYIKKEVPHLTSLDNKLLSDVEGWYKASDPDYISTVNKLFIENISTIHPNVIFYPCFEQSLPEKYMTEYSLFNIFLRQLDMLGFPINTDTILYAGGNENPAVISGHLVPEFNEVLAKVMYNKIQNNRWDFELFNIVATLPHDKEYYYQRRSGALEDHA